MENVSFFHVDADKINEVAYKAELCKGLYALKQVIAIYAGADGGYTVITNDHDLDTALEQYGCTRILKNNPIWFLMTRYTVNFTFYYGNKNLISQLQKAV
jgi:hypothetical protein